MEIGRDKCPNPEVRSAFAQGRLSDALAENIATHFASCLECGREADLSIQNVIPSSKTPLLTECLQNENVRQVYDFVLKETESKKILNSDSVVGQRQQRELPDSVGKYSVLEAIGGGSFGVVYRAEHPHLKKDVAVKVSHAKFHSQQAQRQFFVEAETSAMLDHSNIVKVFDADNLPDGRCFIVLEHVAGNHLGAYLKQSPLAIEKAVEMFSQILRGVSYAHQAGVIHRDLKPANILVDANGIPKVADFGLALTRQDSPTAEFAGTARYMAPEQLRCEVNKIDARTDIFALGLILFEMLTGKTPRSSDVHADIQKRLDFRLDDECIPVALANVCKKCCAPEQRHRFGSVVELLDEIELWQEHGYHFQKKNPSTKVSSIGLAPYGPEHAAMYSSLLDESTRSDGLPDTVAFWKRRIERAGFETCFQVGMIAGPVGSGKTSFVQAGLIPNLSRYIDVTYVDCRKALLTVDALESHSGKFTAEQDNLSSAGKLPTNKTTKKLVILDHFSEGVNRKPVHVMEPVISMMRKCDGMQRQCIVVVSTPQLDDALKMFELIDVALDSQENYQRLHDITSADAVRLLLKLGSSSGCINSEINEEVVLPFLRAAVSQMASSNALDYPTIHLFYKCIQKKAWRVETFKSIGGVEQWRMTYLRSLLHKNGQTENAKFMRVLAAMLQLPFEDGFSANELIRQTGDLNCLEDILRHLQLLPAVIRKRDDGLYGFAESYLVPIVESYLREGKKQVTWRGKQLLALQSNAHIWAAKEEGSELATASELARFSIAKFRRKVSKFEERYLALSRLRVVKKSVIVGIVLLFVLTLLSVAYGSYQANRVASYRASGILQADVPAMFGLVKPMLERTVAAPNKPTESSLNAALILSKSGRCPIGFIAESIADLSTDYQEVAIAALEYAEPETVNKTLVEAFQGCSDLESQKKAKIAFCLARLGDPEPLASLVGENADQTVRTKLITELSEVLSSDSMLELAYTIRKSDPVLAGSLLNALNIDELTGEIEEYLEAFLTPEMATSVHNAAARILMLWTPGDLPRYHMPLTVGTNKSWFNNVDRMTMIMIPGSEEFRGAGYMSATEVRFDDICQFIDARPDLELPLICQYPNLDQEGFPATCVIPETAFLYCNYLSEKEGRQPAYIQVGQKTRSLRAHELNLGIFELDRNSDGYRLPTTVEWNRAVVSNGKQCFLGDLTAGAEAAKKFANFDFAARTILPSGSLLPSPHGFFDLVGNSFELVHPQDSEVSVKLIGGAFLTDSAKILQTRDLTDGFTGAPFVGFRIACPTIPKILKADSDNTFE